MLDVQRLLNGILSPGATPANGSRERQLRPVTDATVFQNELVRATPEDAPRPEPAPIGGGSTESRAAAARQSLEEALLAREAARRLHSGEQPIEARPIAVEPLVLTDGDDEVPDIAVPEKRNETLGIDPVRDERPPVVIGDSEVEDPWIVPDVPEEPPIEVVPEPPVTPAPGSKLLGTRAEYLLDGASGKDSSYRASAVRYWDVYSDGTKILREGWSPWTGTVDVSLANMELKGGNVVGLQFG